MVSRLLWAQTHLVRELPNGRVRRHPLLTIYLVNVVLILGGAVLLALHR
jgi:hypothetical protein